MTEWTIAVGALVIVLSISAGALLSRAYFAPTGAQRAIALLRPVEALVRDEAYCAAEDRNTLHVFLRAGGRVCMDCRTYTAHSPLTSAPNPGGAE